MYKGYKLGISDTSKIFSNKFYGYKVMGENKKIHKKDEILKELEEFLNKDKTEIDGEKLQKEWFKQLDADIFISHSHKDEGLALALAIWLEIQFPNIKIFIDSYIWSSADELLKKIDNKYCLDSNTQTYDYKKRNLTTSHVHAMLSNAILKMINQSECFFLLQTENSICIENFSEKTYSPWLYTEIEYFSKIEKMNHRHKKYKKLDESIKASGEDGIRVKYKPDTSELIELNEDDLINWKNKNKQTEEHFLDVLYKER